MKELYFRREIVVLTSRSYVHDKDGNKVALVKGFFSPFTRKKAIKTVEGETKYIVRNKFWRLFARKGFVFDNNKKLLAKLRRKVISVHDHYDIETELGKITIRGNIIGCDYAISLNDKEIGHVSRKLITMDELVMTLEDEYDEFFFIALVVELNNIYAARNNSDEETTFSASAH